MSSIDKVSPQSVSRAYVRNADGTQTANAHQAGKTGHHHHHQAPKADSVTLSDSARSLSAAREAVQKAPDVREQKVADIKQQVTDGTYSVSSRVLAQKMVEATKNSS
jgi:flagellar biosynthesis anti-sigma factor FlgM